MAAVAQSPLQRREAARTLWWLGKTHGRAALARAVSRLDSRTLAQLASTWQLSAHAAQLRPSDGKAMHLHVGGRGAGKSRGGAEDCLDRMEDWGAMFRGQLVSKRFTDVVDVMCKGDSGLLACAERRGYRLKTKGGKGDFTVTHPNGAEAKAFSAEKADGPRGYECNYAWLDEIAAWPLTKSIECFDNVIFAWRRKTGVAPLMTITTTPRPNPIMFRLLRDPSFAKRISVTRSTTHDNAANLSSEAYGAMVELYHGTSKGRQELEGELLDIAGAIVELDIIHRYRALVCPPLARTVVSVDPAVTSKRDSDATGIVVVGRGMEHPAHAYVLHDATVQRATWSEWGMRVVETFDMWGADAVVAEVNQGGEGIEEQIRVSAAEYSRRKGREVIVPVINVWAKQSKKARAEPIGALYERGRVHHIGLPFAELERELTTWVPGLPSPDRMDALVHGIWNLLLTDSDVLGPIARYGLDSGSPANALAEYLLDAAA